MAKTNNILVKARSPKGFRRSGVFFTREGVEIDPAAFNQSQLDAIVNEPNLVVVGDVPAKEEADLCYRVLKTFEHQGAQIEPAVDGQAPVFIQLSADEAEKLAADGFISTAEEDVCQAPDAKKSGKKGKK